MGKKLLEIDIQKAIEHDNSVGFDTCCRCNGVEYHMDMVELTEDSFLLICDECNGELEEKLITYTDKAVNDLFRNTHLGFSTKFDGMESLEAIDKLSTLKEDMGALLMSTLKMNITKEG